MTVSQQSQLASSLINEITSLDANSSSIFEDETSRVQALSLVRKLAIVLEKPEEAPLHNAFSPSQLTVARIAIDLSLFDLVADGSKEAKSISHLANATQADPALLKRILRLLDCMGWVEQAGDDDSYSATPITEVMTGKPLQACIKHHFDIGLPIFTKLPEYFRKVGYQSPCDVNKGPFQYAFQVEEPAFQWWAKDAELSENFNTFMTGVRGGKPHWVNWFPIQDRLLEGIRSKASDVVLVDVAGGRGHDLHTFIQKFPNTPGRFVLEDLPAVIDDYRNLNPRIEPMKHDIRIPQPVKGARLYFLHHVLHDWPDDASVLILEQIAHAMEPNYSRVLIGENVLPDHGAPILKAELDWAMMTLHCGMTRTVNDWRRLCDRAGLKLVKYWPPPGDGDGILEAVLQGDDESLLV